MRLPTFAARLAPSTAHKQHRDTVSVLREVFTTLSSRAPLPGG
jgi:hypothetical protein